VVQGFELQTGDAVELGCGEDEDVPAGGRMAQREERFVGQLHRVIQAAGARQFVGLDGSPPRSTRRDARLPRGDFFLPFGQGFLRALVDAREVGADPVDFLLLLLAVDPRLRLVGVVEEAVEPEVFVVSDGVELVRVALRALQAEAHHGLSDAVHAVEHSLDAELFGDDRALLVDHAVAQETGRDDLVLCRARDQVAGELIDDELVVGLVAIEGVDHPVAPRPLLAGQVLLEAVAVSIAGGVEPHARPAFAEPRVGHEAF